MRRSRGFRVNITWQQANRIGTMPSSHMFAYNRAVSRLKADATLTRYDLKKEFIILRRTISWLRDVPVVHQYTAIYRARTAAGRFRSERALA